MASQNIEAENGGNNYLTKAGGIAAGIAGGIALGLVSLVGPGQAVAGPLTPLSAESRSDVECSKNELVSVIEYPGDTIGNKYDICTKKSLIDVSKDIKNEMKGRDGAPAINTVYVSRGGESYNSASDGYNSVAGADGEASVNGGLENALSNASESDIGVPVEDKNAIVKSGWSLPKSAYFENMKARSPVYEDGKFNVSFQGFTDAVDANFSDIICEMKSFDGVDCVRGERGRDAIVRYFKNGGLGKLGKLFDYTDDKTKDRAGSLGGKFVDFYKDAGSMIGVSESKNFEDMRDEGRPANKYAIGLGAPARMVKGGVGIAAGVLDIPLRGAVSKAGRISWGAFTGFVKSGLDFTNYAVGALTANTLQPVEKALFRGNSPLTEIINGAVGLTTRFGENVLDMEAMKNANFDRHGNDKGFIGPAIEMGATYFLAADAFEKRRSSRAKSEAEPADVVDPIVDPIVDEVLGDLGDDWRVGR